MPKNLTIESLNLKHSTACQSIYELFQVAYRQEASLLSVPSLPPLELTPAQIARELGIFYGAFLDKKLVGVLQLYENHIDSLVVSPSYQRQGIASKLLHHVFKIHTARITVSTASGNFKAVELYKKFGFRQTQKITLDDIELVKFER